MLKKNRKTILLIITTVVLVLLVSCSNDNKFSKDEKAYIQNFLSQNSDKNYQLKPSGLYYLEVLVGTGAFPVTHDTAFVKYTGMSLGGVIFDSNILNNRTDTLVFPVNEGWLIPGMDEGINYMREGGKASFLIPSSLAYGPAGRYPYISGYQPLLFEVQLVRVKRGPGLK